jgi:hypothetical protein
MRVIALSRRQLFAGVAAAALAGCSASQLAASLPQYAEDAQTIAAGLQASLVQLQSVPGIPAASLAQVSAAIADMQKMAAAISAASTASAALPSVQQLEADVNAVASTLASFSAIMPPQIGIAVQAAAVLLPVIETGVGLVVNAVTAPAPATAAAMTPDQARLVLKALAKQ